MTPAARTYQRLNISVRNKISVFYFARLLLIALVLLSTIFLKQEVLGATVIAQIYAALAASFTISLINVSFWERTLEVRYFMPSQLLYDLLLTSYLVYLTGVNDSIFLFLYLLNIVFASVVYQLNGALLVASLSGVTFAFIYYVNTDMDPISAWYNLAWHELLFLLTALLCGQFMDELKKQNLLLETQKASIARLELLNDKLLNSIPVGIILVDQEEYVQKINLTAMGMLRLTHAPEMRLKYYELLPDLKGIFAAWERMTEAQRLRYLFRSGDRKKPHLALQIAKLKDEGSDSMQRILVIQDVSKILELEEKLEFETKLAATGELAAGIAHEIRNPLASISGSIELLSQHLRIENEQDKKLMAISLRETKRLNNLITDFLEFAKPKDNRKEEVGLQEIIAEVAEAMQSSTSNGGLSIRNDVSGELIASANRERMKQVFFNLFLNAREAAGSEPVNVTVSAASDGNGYILLDVADSGPGIPEGMKDRIFDPFFTTKKEGTGLGLATVARILQAAQGEITLVASSAGARFRLKLPEGNPAALTGTAS